MALRRGAFHLLWAISCRVELDMDLMLVAKGLLNAAATWIGVARVPLVTGELWGVPRHPRRSHNLAPAPPFSLRDQQKGPKGPPSASKALLTPSCAGAHGNPHGERGVRSIFLADVRRLLPCCARHCPTTPPERLCVTGVPTFMGFGHLDRPMPPEGWLGPWAQAGSTPAVGTLDSHRGGVVVRWIERGLGGSQERG